MGIRFVHRFGALGNRFDYILVFEPFLRETLPVIPRPRPRRVPDLVGYSFENNVCSDTQFRHRP
jgi:hypothetical protein